MMEAALKRAIMNMKKMIEGKNCKITELEDLIACKVGKELNQDERLKNLKINLENKLTGLHITIHNLEQKAKTAESELQKLKAIHAEKLNNLDEVVKANSRLEDELAAKNVKIADFLSQIESLEKSCEDLKRVEEKNAELLMELKSENEYYEDTLKVQEKKIEGKNLSIALLETHNKELIEKTNSLVAALKSSQAKCIKLTNNEITIYHELEAENVQLHQEATEQANFMVEQKKEFEEHLQKLKESNQENVQLLKEKGDEVSNLTEENLSLKERCHSLADKELQLSKVVDKLVLYENKEIQDLQNSYNKMMTGYEKMQKKVEEETKPNENEVPEKENPKEEGSPISRVLKILIITILIFVFLNVELRLV